MGRITTHVLDTAAGKPAAGLKVTLTRLDGTPKLIVRDRRPMRTGAATSRCSKAQAFAAGTLRARVPCRRLFPPVGPKLPDPPFLDVVPIRFGMTEDAHYHVPLLLSPYGYSTYRGS